MPSDEEVERAKTADRLVNHEPLLVEALTNVRLKALTELGTVEPSNADAIRRLQAVVACTYELLMQLQTMIVQGDPRMSGSQPSEPA